MNHIEAMKLVRDAIEQGVDLNQIGAKHILDKAIAVYESAPPEAQTEAEKTAYAFGWFKALESQRAEAEAESLQQEPVAWHVSFGNEDEPNYVCLGDKPDEPNATIRPLIFGDTPSQPNADHIPDATEMVEQEPAIDPCKEGTCDCCWKHLDEQEPKREWVVLTDDDLDDIAEAARVGNLHDLRIVIKSKLKEKNK